MYRQIRFNPTVVLFLIVWAIFAVEFVLCFGEVSLGALPLFGICLLNIILGILIFTPLHDATHFVASQNRLFNEVILFFCWPLFLHSPFFFRAIHQLHHRNLGTAAPDPDAFTKASSEWGKWARSFLIVHQYYYFYWLQPNARNKCWHTISSLLLPCVLIGLALTSAYTFEILAIWLVPNIFAIGILGYINTAWPHSEVSGTDHRLHTTRNLYVPLWLQWLMCHQNLHFVHHVRPNLPWYKYRSFWKEHERYYTRQGVCSTRFTSRKPAY